MLEWPQKQLPGYRLFANQVSDIVSINFWISETRIKTRGEVLFEVKMRGGYFPLDGCIAKLVIVSCKINGCFYNQQIASNNTCKWF